MTQCPICERTFKSLAKHMTVHFESSSPVVAYASSKGLDVAKMYKSGKSGNEIASCVNDFLLWSSIGKAAVYKFLDEKGISRRSTKSAMKSYYKENDVWNKGETKDTHPSVAQYAESRLGFNNPIHRVPAAKRCSTNYLNRLKRENYSAYMAHRKHLSERSKVWFQDDANYAMWRERLDAVCTTQEHSDNVKAGLARYFKAYIDAGETPPMFCNWVSKLELALRDELIAREVRFEHQHFIAGRSFDFMLNDFKLVIEVQGDFWHCCPTQYDEDYFHPVRGMTASEIWAYDKEKRDIVLAYGYHVLELWEHEIKNNNFARLDEALKD